MFVVYKKLNRLCNELDISQFYHIILKVCVSFSGQRKFARIEKIIFTEKSCPIFPGLFCCLFSNKGLLVVGKVIIEKSRGGRFLWNRNWDLGWIWAGSATMKPVFFMFLWAKKYFQKHCRRWKHFWHNLKLKKYFFFLKKFKKKFRLRNIFNCVLLH